MKGSYLLHQNLVKECSKAACAEFSNIIVLPYTVGVFRDLDTAERIIHAGIKGVPDTIVIGKNYVLFCDMKTGNADFSKEQKAFKKRLQDITGKDIVHKIKTVVQFLDLIREFENEK